MADNIAITPGSGATVATDDVSGVHYQRVKLVDGTLDGSAAIPGDATNGLDVDVTRIVPGTGATNLGKAIDTALGATDTGVLALAVQKATAVQIGADGDVAPLEVDTTGHLYVNPGSPVVKGTGFSVQVDLTVDAGAYSIGDALGAAMTFANMVSANGKRSVIYSITLTPNDAMPALALNLWLLNADLATPIAKNAAFVIVAADAPKILGIIPINSSDYIPSQTNWNCATLPKVGLEFQAGGATTSIYAYLVVTAVTAPVATHVYLTISGEFID